MWNNYGPAAVLGRADDVEEDELLRIKNSRNLIINRYYGLRLRHPIAASGHRNMYIYL